MVDLLKVAFFMWIGWFLFSRSQPPPNLTPFDRLDIRVAGSCHFREYVPQSNRRYEEHVAHPEMVAHAESIQVYQSRSISQLVFHRQYLLSFCTIPLRCLISCLKNGFVVPSPDLGASPGHSNGAFAFLSLASTPLGSTLSFASPPSLPGRQKTPGMECVT